jgi:chromosome segregation ATPase
MPLFRKKKEPEPGDEPEEEAQEEPKEEEAQADSGDVSLGKTVAELEKLKAKFSTFYEVNKATTERFTRINEQIGELRTMILERDKSGRMLEAKATQAIDMVQTVQPDKLMVDLRKEDAKIEALRANLESNEVVINNAINELKNMRNKMQIFTGMEQVVKLNEEVKKDLMEIKKLGATVERHSDKVETIFSEMQKRFSNFERFSDRVEDIDKSVKETTSDVDSIKAKATDFSSKRDLENLIVKFNNFEKQVSGIITLITKKFDALEQDITDKFKEKLEKLEKMLKGFETLAQKTPDLNKYFNLLEEEAKKAPKEEAKVEKIKVPGEEEVPKGEEKEGFVEKLKGLKDKIPKMGTAKAK